MSHRRKRNLERKRVAEEAERADWKRKTARMLLLEGVPREHVDSIVSKLDPRTIADVVDTLGQSIDFAGMVPVKKSEFHLFLPEGSDPTLHVFATSVSTASGLLNENPHVSLANPRYVVMGAPMIGREQLAGEVLGPDLPSQRNLLTKTGSPKFGARLESSHAWAKESPWILVSYAVFGKHLIANGPRYAIYDLADTIHHEALHVDGTEHNPDLVRRLNEACRWNARLIGDAMPASMDRGSTPFATLVEEHLEMQARFVNEEANEAFRARQERAMKALWDRL